MHTNVEVTLDDHSLNFLDSTAITGRKKAVSPIHLSESRDTLDGKHRAIRPNDSTKFPRVPITQLSSRSPQHCHSIIIRTPKECHRKTRQPHLRLTRPTRSRKKPASSKKRARQDDARARATNTRSPPHVCAPTAAPAQARSRSRGERTHFHLARGGGWAPPRHRSLASLTRASVAPAPLIFSLSPPSSLSASLRLLLLVLARTRQLTPGRPADG